MSTSNKLEDAVNYGVKKVKICTILKREKLWHLICPTEHISIVELTNIPEDTPTILREKRDKAMGILIMSLNDKVIHYDSEIGNPRECWNALKDIFEALTSTRASYLINKIHYVKLDEGGSIVEFIKLVKELQT